MSNKNITLFIISDNKKNVKGVDCIIDKLNTLKKATNGNSLAKLARIANPVAAMDTICVQAVESI